MAADNNYMDESEPATAQDDSQSQPDDKSDETEDQLALVPNHFFKQGPPKPGQREEVEVVQVYENECSIKCVYGQGDKKEEEAEGETAPAESQDDMMG